MKPRLSSSKKWTAFPKEYLQQIESVFYENFEQGLQGRKLIIEGQIYPSEILLRVGFLDKGSIRQINFEVSVDYSKEKQDAVERIYDCLDAAASMMAEYFDSSESVDFPKSWKEYDFKGNKVYLQHSTINTELEKKADELLGLSSKKLVHEDADEESEDALDMADEESEDTSKPTIFSGKSKKTKLH